MEKLLILEINWLLTLPALVILIQSIALIALWLQFFGLRQKFDEKQADVELTISVLDASLQLLDAQSIRYLSRFPNDVEIEKSRVRIAMLRNFLKESVTMNPDLSIAHERAKEAQSAGETAL